MGPVVRRLGFERHGSLAADAGRWSSGERRRGKSVGQARHNAAIVAVLFLLIGAKLIGDAIAGFSA